MTDVVVRKTKHIDESYALQYGTPALANGVGWDDWSARVNVCAERMVVVFEASNETGRRDDAGVGLLRWRQGTCMMFLWFHMVLLWVMVRWFHSPGRPVTLRSRCSWCLLLSVIL